MVSLARPSHSELDRKNEAVLLFASLLLGELLGHTLEETLWHVETEARHVSALVQQTAQQHSTVLRMLFLQGSAVAAGLVRDLVPPEAFAAGIPFDEVTELREARGVLLLIAGAALDCAR